MFNNFFEIFPTSILLQPKAIGVKSTNPRAILNFRLNPRSKALKLVHNTEGAMERPKSSTRYRAEQDLKCGTTCKRFEKQRQEKCEGLIVEGCEPSLLLMYNVWEKICLNCAKRRIPINITVKSKDIAHRVINVINVSSHTWACLRRKIQALRIEDKFGPGSRDNRTAEFKWITMMSCH